MKTKLLFLFTFLIGMSIINASQLQANSIQVYDMSGRTVLNIENTLNTESINVSELKQGIYILVTDTRKQFRFLKQ